MLITALGLRGSGCCGLCFLGSVQSSCLAQSDLWWSCTWVCFGLLICRFSRRLGLQLAQKARLEAKKQESAAKATSKKEDQMRKSLADLNAKLESTTLTEDKRADLAAKISRVEAELAKLTAASS